MKGKKIFFWAIVGLGVAFSFCVFAYEKSNSWNIGNGWIWIKKIDDATSRANVDVPVDGSNIANKDYVLQIFGNSSGGGQGGTYYYSNGWGAISCATLSCEQDEVGSYDEGCGTVCCRISDSGFVPVSCARFTSRGTWIGPYAF